MQAKKGRLALMSLIIAVCGIVFLLSHSPDITAANEPSVIGAHRGSSVQDT